MHLGFEPESLGLGMLLMILFLLNTSTIRVLPNIAFIFIWCILIALIEWSSNRRGNELIPYEVDRANKSVWSDSNFKTVTITTGETARSS